MIYSESYQIPNSISKKKNNNNKTYIATILITKIPDMNLNMSSVRQNSLKDSVT